MNTIIHAAGLNIGIQTRNDISNYLAGFFTADRPDFTVSVPREDVERELLQTRRQPNSYLEFVCAYRVIAERLPGYDAFVMHGATIALDEREALLFTAPSGMGKTTHTRLWLQRFPDRVRVLNGDKPILRRLDGTFYACGTPWRGKENLGDSSVLPLKGICLLRRGKENEIRRITAPEALGELMHQVYLPKQPEQLQRFLDLLDECMQTVPLYSMACNMDVSAAVTAYEAMTGQRAESEQERLP